MDVLLVYNRTNFNYENILTNFQKKTYAIIELTGLTTFSFEICIIKYLYKKRKYAYLFRIIYHTGISKIISYDVLPLITKQNNGKMVTRKINVSKRVNV